MKSVIAVAAVVIVGVLIQRTIASEPRADLTPGVETADWIRLNVAPIGSVVQAH